MNRTDPSLAALVQNARVFSAGAKPSELHLQRQLNRARTADLIKRIQSSQTLRLPEVDVIEKPIWVSEIRMIENVEEVASELKIDSKCFLLI